MTQREGGSRVRERGWERSRYHHEAAARADGRPQLGPVQRRASGGSPPLQGAASKEPVMLSRPSVKRKDPRTRPSAVSSIVSCPSLAMIVRLEQLAFATSRRATTLLGP